VLKAQRGVGQLGETIATDWGGGMFEPRYCRTTRTSVVEADSGSLFRWRVPDDSKAPAVPRNRSFYVLGFSDIPCEKMACTPT